VPPFDQGATEKCGLGLGASQFRSEGKGREGREGARSWLAERKEEKKKMKRGWSKRVDRKVRTEGRNGPN
jgi:hypothetical protein